MIKGRKITILGAGKVGATIAYTLAVQQLVSEIALIDVNRQKAEGEAMDIVQGARFITPVKIYSGDCSAAAGSDIVIYTLGLPRQPGMSRLDLVNTNVGIFKGVLKEIAPYTPESVHVVVSNPVDVLTYAVTKMTGFPAKRVIGSGTLLDTSRLRAFLAELTGRSHINIHAYVLAEHGDTSFIPWSMASIYGVKLTDYVEETLKPKEQWKAKILEDVRMAGARVIANKGSTHFAVAMSVCEICKNVLGDSGTIFPLSNMLTGQYGIEGVCLSLPFAVEAQGLGDCIAAKLTPEEEEALHRSAESLKAICGNLEL